MPTKWCTYCESYKNVSFESSTYCPSCKQYKLVSSTISNRSWGENVASTSSALADTANSKNVEIECKVEQSNVKSGEYRSASMIIRPRK